MKKDRTETVVGKLMGAEITATERARLVRLANAAPKLLAAVKLAAQSLQIWAENSAWDADDEAALAACDAALAQAEGR